jgi:hypothetical protein
MSSLFYRVQPIGLPLLGHTSRNDTRAIPKGYVYAWTSPGHRYPDWFWQAREPPATEIVAFTGTEALSAPDDEGAVLVRPLKEICRCHLAKLCKNSDEALVITTLNLASAVSPHLGGRFRSQGSYSGEAFRDDILIPLLDFADLITVDLDGIEGPTPGFFEEAFGGLVRAIGAAALFRIEFRADVNRHLVVQADLYLTEAVRALKSPSAGDTP